MGFRFRKRIKIAPGLSINISKSGVSTSIGGKGSTVNIGKKGVKATTSIPGTGISHSSNLLSFKNKSSKESISDDLNAVEESHSKRKTYRNIFLLIAICYIIMRIIEK
ncbi:DUF4236 domain-containing protein [Hafnia paralvei]|uniref:DUF4236 domain-containing protein n=1 Tax=Hafnia paralvei TaxID=546367 RepID=UPI0024BAEB5D|nr:DUF4236 domain-containing protein [Hafnia paralvei]